MTAWKIAAGVADEAEGDLGLTRDLRAGKDAREKVEGDLRREEPRLGRLRQRQESPALLEERVDPGGAELRRRQYDRRDGAAQTEGAQRIEQPGEADGGRRRREQPILPEPGEFLDAGDGGKSIPGRGAVRGDDGAASGRQQGERLAVGLDLAAEDRQVDPVEAVLFHPGDERRSVEALGERADHRFVEREEPQVGAQVGALAEALGDLLAEQRQRVDEGDPAHAALAGAGGAGRPMPARLSSQSAGPESA